MKARLVQLLALCSLLAAAHTAHAGIIALPEASWSANSIDFGDVAVGDTSTRTVNLIIGCFETACTYNIVFTANEFSASPTSGTLSVAGTTTLAIEIAFAPVSVGYFLDTATVTVTDELQNTASASLDLKANAVAASVPEPSTLGLLGAALLGLSLVRRKRAAWICRELLHSRRQGGLKL